MKRNMNAADQIVRAVLAAAAVWLAIALGAATAGGVVAVVFAAIMTVTAISRSARLRARARALLVSPHAHPGSARQARTT